MSGFLIQYLYMHSHSLLNFKKILHTDRFEKNPRLVIYLLVFLFTLHLTPSIYINSTFLEQLSGREAVGYIYAISSLLTIFAFVISRRHLQKYGNYKVFYRNIWINLICLIILSTSLVYGINPISSILYILAFIIAEVTRATSFMNLDIFLEHYSKNGEAGGIRGFFLTSLNLAFMIGPFITSLLVIDTSDIGKVYLWGIALALPVLYIARKYLSDFKDSRYEKSDIVKTAKLVWKKKDLYKIFISNLLLRFFYAWAVIYIPIYLHENIGFSLSDVSLIISIALIPFIILQLPLGNIADDYLGEKELLTTGLIIMGLSTLSIFFIQSNIFWIWALILFLTRVGASMVEIMTETYLFKKIDDDDINILGLYRAVRPVAYILGPVFASILLLYVDISYLFIILGVILIYGVRYSLTLKDTK